MARPPKFTASVLLDTTVVLRAFWPLQFQDDPRTDDCVKLLDYLMENSYLILISAVTVAEFEMEDATRTLPVNEGIEVVSFDQLAGRGLARMLDSVVEQQMREEGSTRRGVRYDMQIAASAARWGAKLIATLDGPLRKTVGRIAHEKLADLRAMTAAEMLQHFNAQISLFGAHEPEPAALDDSLD